MERKLRGNNGCLWESIYFTKEGEIGEMREWHVIFNDA